MSKLFSPICLGPLHLANRIVIPPMCQNSAFDGKANDWHTIHLGHLALSGAGLLIVEATAVEPEGRISPADLGLWNDETEDALAITIKSVRKHSGIPIGIQLAHAGRKASTAKPWEGDRPIPTEGGGWKPLAPSPIPYYESDPLPEELTKSRIGSIVARFVDAAKRADRVGFDALEIHAAHGYLLHEFLSPLSNCRNDEYGDTPKNRMKLPLDVFRAVRDAFTSEKPVGVRISATDWIDGGWSLDDSVVFAEALEKQGCAYIHVSSAGLSEKQKIAVSPGFQVPFARKIKENVSIPVIAVGLITEPEFAESIIANGDADMVAIGRGMLYDPRWPWHAAAKLGTTVQAPNQYLRSVPHSLKNLFMKRTL